jgi:Sec-independent protein secretion pathway component TatC
MVFGNWSTGGSFAFFMLQPLGIAFETVITNVFCRVGIQMHWRISRMVGFVWVLLWFSYTVPILVGPLLTVGFSENGPSFSLILGIRRGEWFPKV